MYKIIALLLILTACSTVRPYNGKSEVPTIHEHVADFHSHKGPFMQDDPLNYRIADIGNPFDYDIRVIVVCSDGPTTLTLNAHTQQSVLVEVSHLYLWDTACAIHRWELK